MKFVLYIALIIYISASAVYGEGEVFDDPFAGIPRLPISKPLKCNCSDPRGEEIEEHSNPHLVAIIITTGRGTIICQGSIINDVTVTVSGLCVYEATEVEVVAGAHDIAKEEPNNQRRRANKTDIHLHEGFQSNWRANDVAVIWMTIALIFNNFVKPITIPDRFDVDSFVGYTVTVVSWGNSWERPRYHQNIIISNSLCLMMLGGEVGPNNLCMSTLGGRGPCHGDTSAPITIEVGGEKYVIGALTFLGHTDCNSGKPAVFSRLPAHKEWIKKKKKCSQSSKECNEETTEKPNSKEETTEKPTETEKPNSKETEKPSSKED